MDGVTTSFGDMVFEFVVSFSMRFSLVKCWSFVSSMTSGRGFSIRICCKFWGGASTDCFEGTSVIVMIVSLSSNFCSLWILLSISPRSLLVEEFRAFGLFSWSIKFWDRSLGTVVLVLMLDENVVVSSIFNSIVAAVDVSIEIFPSGLIETERKSSSSCLVIVSGKLTFTWEFSNPSKSNGTRVTSTSLLLSWWFCSTSSSW